MKGSAGVRPTTVVWHSGPAADLVRALDSGPGGLSHERARRRRAEVGPNEIPRQRTEGPLRLLWRQIAQPLIYVLLGAAVLSALAAELVDAAVIFGVIAVNALIAGRGLMVDEALLTGESVPVEKAADDNLAADVLLPERRNMLYAGTIATAGQGRAVVVATGAGTELARISELVASAEQMATPLTRRIAAFSGRISAAALARAEAGVSEAEAREARLGERLDRIPAWRRSDRAQVRSDLERARRDRDRHRNDGRAAQGELARLGPFVGRDAQGRAQRLGVELSALESRLAPWTDSLESGRAQPGREQAPRRAAGRDLARDR